MVTVRLLQEIDPFRKFPLINRASDLAQSTGIVNSLLSGVAPVDVKTITGVVSGASVSASAPVPCSQHIQTDTEREYMPGKQVPNYARSVVQVLSTYQEPDYDQPWKGVDVMSCSGTGLVIGNEGKKYILTNAHCVENAVIVRVRLADDRKRKYEATRKCISYQCDLALLEVSDPEFAEKSASVKLGEMAQLQKKVYTVGFPIGGNEISITKGIVSRIETGEYATSEQDMLQVQVDSAINHGNSGGPVFSDGAVVGIAFQGDGRRGAQNLGYMIPVPVINHFLAEAFSGRAYRGFPILPVQFQTLENAALRKFYGLKKDQSGVRINNVQHLCDAYSKLKRDDILLEIDSHPVSNTGTIDMNGVGNCIDLLHITHMKFIGDTVNLKVLRKNAVTGHAKIHDIEVLMDHVPYEITKVPATEHDKMPTYFIASGIVLTPVTRNYLDQSGADLLDRFLEEEGCLLVNAPKKSAGEEIIVINSVLDCEETEGYDDYVNSIVRDINGKPVKNMDDVVKAIEDNREKMHYMTTAGRKKIVVRAMNRYEHTALLARYHINFDRSEDLRLLQIHQNDQEISGRHLISGNSSYNSPSEFVRKRPLLATATPGLGMFNAKVDEMYARYSKQSEEDNELDADFVTDSPGRTESRSPSGSEAEEASSSGEFREAENMQLQHSSHLISLTDRPGLFKRKSMLFDDMNTKRAYKKRKLNQQAG